MHIDPVFVCRSLGGVATLKELLQAGVSRSSLQQALASRLLLRVRRGTYAMPSFPPELLHALRHAGRISCHSLLKAEKVWTLEDQRLHLHLDPGVHLARPGECSPVVQRYETRREGGPAAVSVLSSLAEIGRCLGTEHLVVALDSARRLGLVADAELGRLRCASPRHLRIVLDHSTALADSGLESLVRWRLLLLGIVAAPPSRLGDGGERDLLVGDALLIETDGGSHDAREQRLRDHQRDAYAAERGYVTLRFSYDQVVHRWPEAEAAILAAISQGLHRRQR